MISMLIKGKFIKYIYKNIETNFSVAIFKLDNEFKSENYELNSIPTNIVISIKEFDISINKLYTIKVNKSKNKKYEDSYELIAIEKNIVDSITSAIDYLASKKISGITKQNATLIINNLGLRFLESPDEYLDKLKNIISEKKSILLIEQINSEKIYQQVLDKFSKNNLSMRLLYIIEKKYQNEKLIEFLENDIYSILEEDESINFFDVDNAAEIFLKNFSNDIRIEKYILWSLLNTSFSTGSTLFEIKNLFFLIGTAFGMTKDEFLEATKRLITKNQVFLSANKQSISAKSLYNKEVYIVQRLLELKTKNIELFSEKIIDNDIDEIQNQALNHALNNSFTIISGFPGTGKTTLVDKLIRNLKNDSFNLLAPTGKAAYQIFLKTGKQAKTIHSFLGMKKGSNFFRINEENPSNVETLIIDEFSMINIDLFYSLLIGCPYLKRLILIGDKNQLPSIGAGYLLNDIIASNQFNSFLLKKIYRQEIGSSIIKTALTINDQKMPDFNSKESIFIDAKNELAQKKIMKKVDQFITEGIKLNDYQILVPMYSGPCGIDSLNTLIQEKYSNNKEKIEIRNSLFYIGDKVIQIENNNEENVFNGEIGYIIKFDISTKLKVIIVQFEDGKIIKYSPTNFSKNIKLAYAISIHKFQGSESKNIILVMNYSHYPLLSKKLLYTAVTRAVEKLIVIGEVKAIEICINNDNDSKRVGNILNLLLSK